MWQTASRGRVDRTRARARMRQEELEPLYALAVQSIVRAPATVDGAGFLEGVVDDDKPGETVGPRPAEGGV